MTLPQFHKLGHDPYCGLISINFRLRDTLRLELQLAIVRTSFDVCVVTLLANFDENIYYEVADSLGAIAYLPSVCKST